MSDLEKKDTPAIKPVKFDHVKGAQFRSYHADGAWGVASSNGNINLHFYIEHPKMADGAILPLGPDGQLQNKMQIVGAGESDPTHYVITRDLQCAIVLSISAAANLQEQLEHYLRLAGPEYLKESTEEKK